MLNKRFFIILCLSLVTNLNIKSMEEESISGLFDSQQQDVNLNLSSPISLGDSNTIDGSGGPFFDDSQLDDGKTFYGTSKYLNEKDKVTYLHNVAKVNHQDCSSEIEIFTKLGCGVNDQNIYGQTPLHIAVAWNNSSFIRDLFKFCEINNNSYALNLNIKNINEYGGKTAFESAIDKLYLEYDSNINSENFCASRRKFTSNMKIVELFLDARKELIHGLISKEKVDFKKIKFILNLLPENYFNLQDSYGDTLAHKASRWGHEEILKYLIEERNINLNLINKIGRTALHESILHKKQNITQLLIDSKKILIDKNIKDNFGKTAIDYAIALNYPINIYTMINSNEADYSHIMSCVKNGSEEDLENLLRDNSLNILEKNQYGMNALSVAIINNNVNKLKTLFKYLPKNNSPELIIKILKYDQDSFKNSLLALSSHCNSLDCAVVINNFLKKF